MHGNPFKAITWKSIQSYFTQDLSIPPELGFVVGALRRRSPRRGKLNLAYDKQLLTLEGQLKSAGKYRSGSLLGSDFCLSCTPETHIHTDRDLLNYNVIVLE